MIPYGRQSINDDDIQAVNAVLASDWLTQGPVITQFEQALSDVVGLPYVHAVSNGTAALHLACLALDVGRDSQVWVSANSFVASANCAEYCGAQVDFVDIDETGCICVNALEHKLARHHKQKRPMPNVLVCVHYAGQWCDLPRLVALSKQYDFDIIEDAAHQLMPEFPAIWDKQARGRLVTYSFHPVKMITTGEGGAVACCEQALDKKVRLLASHGIEKDPARLERSDQGGWYYEQQQLGFNYRMSDLHAALGLSQLKRLPDFLAKRRAIATRYQKELPDAITPVSQTRFDESSYHLFPVLIDEHRSADVFAQLREQGVWVQKHYIPIPLQPYFANKYGYDAQTSPQATSFYRREISLPIFADLTCDQQSQVIDLLARF